MGDCSQEFIGGAAYSFFTDYERGAVRKIPVTAHMNIDTMSGLQLVLASATFLRGEPVAGRWAVAALGAYEVLAAAITDKPMGPAWRVRVPGRYEPAPVKHPARLEADARAPD